MKLGGKREEDLGGVILGKIVQSNIRYRTF